MATIRGRLAVWYMLALAATIFLFGTILYVVQRSQAFTELDRRVELEADLIAAVLHEAYRASQPLVVTSSITGRPVLAPEVADLFQGVPGFVVLLLKSGDILFVSAEARTVSVPAFTELFDVVEDPTSPGAFGNVNLTPPFGEVRYFVRPLANAGPRIAGVVVGIPTEGAGLAPTRLLVAMLLIAPFGIAVSWFIGYFLVGRTFKPVEQIVDEVQAISDGRSLHRRLALPASGDELGSLSTT
jgi:two-component system OmpR family sensor kinase